MPYIAFKDYPNKKYKCPIRFIRICSDNKINRLADFSKMTFKEVLSLPECGKTTAIFVGEILQENGLDFRGKAKMNVFNFGRRDRQDYRGSE